MTLTSEVAEGKWFGYRSRELDLTGASVFVEEAIHDAFIAGFESGAKWGIQTSAKLSDPSFREAIAAVAEGLNRDG